MKNTTDIKALAFSYFDGSIQRSQESIVLNYINASQLNYEQFRLWEKEWIELGSINTQVEQEWIRFQNRMRTQAAISVFMAPPKQFKWRYIAAAAAIIVFILGGTYATWQSNSISQLESFVTFEVPYGEKSKITLSDGTLVWLNAGSTLKYSNKFGLSNREVYLDGEGYFEVTKKMGEEFIVKTEDCDVIVKGTQFNLTAYSNDNFVTTTLLEGAVQFRYEEQILNMDPGESLSLEKRSKMIIRKNVDPFQSRAWSENRIQYEAITLNELFVRLSRQYNANINYKMKKNEEKRFNITLRNHETISEVLDAISEIIPISIERKNGDIYIIE